MGENVGLRKVEKGEDMGALVFGGKNGACRHNQHVQLKKRIKKNVNRRYTDKTKRCSASKIIIYIKKIQHHHTNQQRSR